jgi:hypothetical protein
MESQKTPVRKLVLSRETLNRLDDQDVQHLAAGAFTRGGGGGVCSNLICIFTTN